MQNTGARFLLNCFQSYQVPTQIDLFSCLIGCGVATATVTSCKRFPEVPLRTSLVISWISWEFSLAHYVHKRILSMHLEYRNCENGLKKRKHGNWGVRQPVPFLLLTIIILFSFKYHHWRNPMSDLVPKPTPSCFALLCISPSRFSPLLLQTEHLEVTKAWLALPHQAACLFVWCFFQIWKFFY